MENELLIEIDILKEEFGDISIKSIDMNKKSQRMIIGFDMADGRDVTVLRTPKGEYKIISNEEAINEQ